MMCILIVLCSVIILFESQNATLLKIFEKTLKTVKGAKVLQDRAAKPKKLGLTKSLLARKVVAELVSELATSPPSHPCNLNTRVRNILESIQGGRIRT